MSTEYYTYIHRPGYGSTDHLADEIIARAARHLGLDTGDYIAQCAGFASHSVPQGRAEVRILAEKRALTRMKAAIREARSEFPCRPSCCIEIVCVRSVLVFEGEFHLGKRYNCSVRLHEEKRPGGRWEIVSEEP